MPHSEVRDLVLLRLRWVSFLDITVFLGCVSRRSKGNTVLGGSLKAKPQWSHGVLSVTQRRRLQGFHVHPLFGQEVLERAGDRFGVALNRNHKETMHSGGPSYRDTRQIFCHVLLG